MKINAKKIEILEIDTDKIREHYRTRKFSKREQKIFEQIICAIEEEDLEKALDLVVKNKGEIVEEGRKGTFDIQEYLTMEILWLFDANGMSMNTKNVLTFDDIPEITYWEV